MQYFVASLLAVFVAEDPEWGAAKDGLMTRLTLVSKEAKIGAPIRLKLELKNTAAKALTYYDQAAGIHDSLAVTGPDGKPVPYVYVWGQTLFIRKELKAGDSTTVFADLDLAEQYLIDKPGKYSVTTKPRGLPASNALEITVADAPVPEKIKLVISIRKTLPKGWQLQHWRDDIDLVNSPTGLIDDVVSVWLFFTKTKEPGREGAEYLFETKLGHAWIVTPSPRLVERWPDWAKFIRQQLEAFKK